MPNHNNACSNDLGISIPDMTRAEVQAALEMDGGLNGYETVRYLHPHCQGFKIDVTYAVVRDHADQGRVKPTPQDKALSVSKPYAEAAFFD